MGRYSNRFVLCILVNGQVQKDLANGEVHIPFGSEYVVRARNKNDRRAVVELSIDGETVGRYVVEARSHYDIRRWADKDVAFKFVDLESEDAYDHGKQGPNPDKSKGLVVASFFLEKARPAPAKVEHIYHHYTPTPWPGTTIRRPTCDLSSHEVRTADVRSGGACSMSNSVQASNAVGAASISSGMEFVKSMSIPSPIEEGCTVEGGRTGDRLRTVHVDVEEVATVLSLFLKGYKMHATYRENVYVNEGPSYMPSSPVDHKGGVTAPGFPSDPPASSSKFCTECGHGRMNEAKFCGNCGNKF